MCPDSRKAPAGREWLIRRMDQAGVALCVLAAILAMAGWWVSQGGLQRRLIELDRSRPQTAEFRVDINRAEWPELAQLPGVGETLAKFVWRAGVGHQNIDRVKIADPDYALAGKFRMIHGDDDVFGPVDDGA